MRTALATTGFLLVLAFFLTTEHRAHVFGLLPYLLVLACPLIHLFGHSGHGHESRARGGVSNRHEGHGDGSEARP